MYKFVSNTTVFQFSSAYKKTKATRTHTHAHKHKEKLHNTYTNSTCNGRPAENYQELLCITWHPFARPTPISTTYEYVLCSVETSQWCCLSKGTSGLQSQCLTSWKNKLNWPLSPLQPKRSPQLDSHYTHKGTFINTTFNLLLVKT